MLQISNRIEGFGITAHRVKKLYNIYIYRIETYDNWSRGPHRLSQSTVTKRTLVAMSLIDVVLPRLARFGLTAAGAGGFASEAWFEHMVFVRFRGGALLLLVPLLVRRLRLRELGRGEIEAVVLLGLGSIIDGPWDPMAAFATGRK